MKGITDVAGQRLKEALEQANVNDEKAVRLFIGGQGAVLKVDAVRDSDQAFEHEDRTVLVLDATANEATAGSTLDYQEGQYRFV